MDEPAVTAISMQAVIIFGGLSGDVRYENPLRAASGRPLNKWHFDEPKPDVFTLAAAYCFALIKGRPFHDDNKRTAYIVAIGFVQLNGFSCAPEQADIVQNILGAASGTVSECQLINWFKLNSRPL